MKDYKNEFVEYLREKNSSKNTVESYINDIDKFILYLNTLHISGYCDINKDMLMDYVEYMKVTGYSLATITRNIASIRALYEFLISIEVTDKNPAKQIKTDISPKKYPEILTNDEIDLLLSQPDIKDPKGCRDKAMLELLYATGIRVSELINLNIQDINLNRGVLFCRSSRSERIIPIYSSAISSVSDYIYRVRNTIINKDSDEALFINLNGMRLTRQGFWKIIKAYARSANINKEITPHTLRHSFALHLLENGADVKDIQTMLGHADISSTQVYVRMMDEHVNDVYKRCHPKAKARY